MTNPTALAALLLASSALAAPPAQDQERGELVLFPGDSLADWAGAEACWRVEGGVVIGELPPGAREAQDLVWTARDVRDFELCFRFRIEGGNSGVYFRAESDAQHRVAGYQADLDGERRWTGCLYEEGGRGLLATRGQRVVYMPDGTRHAAQHDADEELRQVIDARGWNEYRIRAVGERVELFLNGVRTAELIDHDELYARSSGKLALQLHPGGPMRVEFKDFVLQDLGGAEQVGETALQIPGSAGTEDGRTWPRGQWIWSGPEGGEGVPAWFRKTFGVGPELARATLRGTCDNRCRVFLNGKQVAESDNWFEPFEVDVARALQRGDNQLAVWAYDEGVAAGLNLELELVLQGGKVVTSVVTDASWRTSTDEAAGWKQLLFDDSRWALAHSFGGPDAQPWRGFRDLVFGGVLEFELEVEDFVVSEDFELATGPAEPAPQGAADEKQWIWSSARPGDADRAWFRCTFEVTGEVRRATLFGACDNLVEVRIGGKQVAEGDDWAKPFELSVKEALGAGRNVIAARAENQGGPAGLVLELVIEYAGGATETVRTDGTWKATAESTVDWASPELDDSGWAPATILGPWGTPPWGRPAARSSGKPGGALDAEALELPDGFEAELLYSVPKGEQGSWVSITSDPRGRLIVSDQYGALYRVTPQPVGRTDQPPLVEKIEVELGEAQGLLVAFGDLYVVSNGSRSGLWRVRDTDGDDAYDAAELLKQLDGSGEHGPHAVLLAPDGESLYVIAGNHTKLPDGITTFLPTRAWDEDQLLPRLPDANGHANGIMAPGGWICRTDRDGRDWTLVSIGTRNPYDMDFDQSGELFSFDADMEWDIGLPWYRPTRVTHMVPGSEFGWRHGSGKWPAYYEDGLPAVVDIGISSPTGVMFGTRSHFPGRWKRAFYIADWSYGTIYAVHLEPAGASFSGTFEAFARGKPFQVTDLTFAPDGAMYVTTGGRRTQSGLYRIRSTSPSTAPGAPVAAGAREREERRRIEAGLGGGAGLDAMALMNRLASEDRFVRFAARTTLEQRPVDEWHDMAFNVKHDRARVQALIALARVGDVPAERIAAALDEVSLRAPQPRDVILGALRAYQLAFIRRGAPSAATRERLGRRFADLFGGDPDVDRELFRLMVHLEAPGTVAAGLKTLREADTQERAIDYAFMLRTLESGWTLEQRRTYFEWIREVALSLAGGNSLTKYMRNMRDDAIRTLTDDERRSLAQWLTEKPPEAVAVEASAPFVRAYTREELEPLLGSLGSGRDFERGRKAFDKAGCLTCHRIAGDGGATGHDLTGAGSRFNPRDLLESILEPSKEISDQYQDTEVLTSDDVLIVGKVEQETADMLVLRTAGDEVYEVSQADVALRRPHPLSRMPAGTLDVLTPAEIRDLLAYVLAGGDPAGAAFR
jgi:putative heme-binding domain-containing protein